MKKKIIIAFTLTIISMVSIAQNTKGDGVLTVGTSVSFFGSKPFNATYDYALTNRFSLGVAGNYTNRHNAAGNLSRTNLAARALYHIIEESNFDLYTGGRLGISIWEGSGFRTDYQSGLEDLTFAWKGGRKLPSFQGVFGFRYLLLGRIGVNTELAIGSPYFFSAGLSAKINNRRKEKE
ncbi:MAG: hypothetical protein V4608_03555 [Bacteroidota bacterium]